jgi:hypothetical protein
MVRYVIRVDGALSPDLLTAFPQLLASSEPVSTVLEGTLPDQAALSSVLDRLDELGVTITDVARLPEPTGSSTPGRRP